MGNGQANLELGLQIILKHFWSQSPETSFPFPVLHPTGTKRPLGQFSPSPEKK